MKLTVERFSLGEQVNQTWVLTAEAETPLEALLAPEYFANVANKMRPYDKIYARVDTGEWYAELLVVSCGRAWAKVVILQQIDFTSKEVEIIPRDGSDDYSIKYKGPHLKFCVIRNSDREVIKDHLDTQAEANGWLSSFLIKS